jgi:hypothetical protein
MKVSMVNSLGRAPGDSPAPPEGAGAEEATGAAEAEGVEGFSAMEVAEAEATGAVDAEGEAVPLEGLLGVAGALPEPEPAPKRAGPGMVY